MNVFVEVAKTGSFAEAARNLQLHSSAASRSVSGLENRIGRKLLIRNIRPMKLTKCGQTYLLDCERLLKDIQRAEAAVKRVGKTIGYTNS